MPGGNPLMRLGDAQDPEFVPRGEGEMWKLGGTAAGEPVSPGANYHPLRPVRYPAGYFEKMTFEAKAEKIEQDDQSYSKMNRYIVRQRSSLNRERSRLMSYLSKASCAIGMIAAIAVTASAADARPRETHGRHASDAYQGAYDAYRSDSAPSGGVSIPYDAGGVAYGPGQRDMDSSNDFQLQGR